MKKSFLALSLLFTLSFFAIPSSTQAGDCNAKVQDVTDFTVEVKTDLKFRKSIQGAPDENCPESEVIGSFGVGKVLWVLGVIETSFVINEETQEAGTWYYLKHPTTGEYGFIWSAYTKKVDPPQGEAHVEEVIDMADGSGGDSPSPVTPGEEPQTLKDIIGHPYEEAIRYLEAKKIVEGVGDGTYRPEASIDRAAFTKIVVGSKIGSNPTASADNCFPDVLKDQWYASYICYAKNNSIISGHPNGTFKPGDPVNLVEAAKILVKTFELDHDPETSIWYETYLAALQRDGYIPDTFTKPDQLVSRAQMGEIMWRIMEGIHTKPSTTFPLTTLTQKSELMACLDKHLDSSIDMSKVREAWLTWHNEARQARNLSPVVMHEALDYSSSLWAKENKASGEITHDRPDNQTPGDWFTSIGVTFEPINGIVSAENLGQKTYACEKSNCTEDMIAAAKSIFEAFMAEEGTAFTGHYDNIVEPNIKQLGLGLAVDEGSNMLYLTSHYAQAVEDFPSTCQ